MDEGTMNSPANQAVRPPPRYDTPTGVEYQPRSPAKTIAYQRSGQQTTHSTNPTKDISSRPTSHPTTPAKHSRLRPTTQPSSRPASPVKKHGSRPSSRPASPFKKAPGKNEHLETSAVAFYYSIELPESKIVPKKDTDASPPKSRPSTPVTNNTPLKRADSPMKSAISPSRPRSPNMSMSPRQELLKQRAASPAKQGTEPTPTPRNAASRDTISLTKIKSLTDMNGTHAGATTVENTREYMWRGATLNTPLTPSSNDNKPNVKGTTAGESENEPHVTAESSNTLNETGEETTSSRRNVATLARKSSSGYCPTNIGMMMRGISQEALQTRAPFDEKVDEKDLFSSPAGSSSTRRKSDITVVSLPRTFSRQYSNERFPAEDAIPPIFEDLAVMVNKTTPVNASKKISRPDIPVRSKSTGESLTGTPPALVAAIETDMQDLRVNLQQPMGDKHADSPRSPRSANWFGSTTTPSSLPPNPPLIYDPQDTPRPGHRCIPSSPPVLIAPHNTPVATRPTPHRRVAPGMEDCLGTGVHSLPIVRQESPKALALGTGSKEGGVNEPLLPLRSRLPRASPNKGSSRPKPSGFIPQAARTSVFDVSPREKPSLPTALLTPSRVPAMASRRLRQGRATQEEGEVQGFASAEDIAKQVEEWHSEEQKKNITVRTRAQSPTKNVPRSRSKRSLTKPTTTTKDTTDKESYTPEGSPAKSLSTAPSKRSTSPAKMPNSPPRNLISSLKNPKLRTNAPTTPLPSKKLTKVRGIDRGPLRTPSKEMASKLDAEIDRHLEGDARAGRMFTPSGQRISDLLAAKRRSDGEED
ncbi:hypothetical protein N0V90_004659 [Kalmusia sp. IMI 367209]|nr:hypothetical protein N0V90_004659 [Kalmusia sp. IMI 367209]